MRICFHSNIVKQVQEQKLRNIFVVLYLSAHLDKANAELLKEAASVNSLLHFQKYHRHD